jgi:hypothetical protein
MLGGPTVIPIPLISDVGGASLASGPKRVIVCRSSKVIPWTSGMPYIYLSCVWGNSATQDEPDKNQPPGKQLLGKKLPQTIQDAIEVVKRLGQKYLWIDRYWIDHNNLKEEHNEIQHTDDVYEGAVVTLVAVGPDANYGLPRVSAHSESKQLSPRRHYGTLRSTLPDFHHTWNALSRARGGGLTKKVCCQHAVCSSRTTKSSSLIREARRERESPLSYLNGPSGMGKTGL